MGPGISSGEPGTVIYMRVTPCILGEVGRGLYSCSGVECFLSCAWSVLYSRAGSAAAVQARAMHSARTLSATVTVYYIGMLHCTVSLNVMAYTRGNWPIRIGRNEDVSYRRNMESVC
jgi:hypothetical protein